MGPDFDDRAQNEVAERFAHDHSTRRMIEMDAAAYALGVAARQRPVLRYVVNTVLALSALMLVVIAIVSLIRYGRL